MNDSENIQILPSSTIREAVSVLEGVKSGIVLIVNEQRKLLGTITDGDVRRALINLIPLDENVKTIMSETPVVASRHDNSEKIRELMRVNSLLQIPITDEENRIVGIEILEPLSQESGLLENPVVLMAGGYGKRLRPFTINTPKPLLRVGSKPIAELILEQLSETGFNQFFFSVHYQADKLKRYFGDGKKWNVEIRYLDEERPLGTAGSLGLLPDDLLEFPILVMNSDLLTRVNFRELLRHHEHEGGVATICARDYEFQVPYGVVETEGMALTDITEKPQHRFFVNAGIYVLNPSVIKKIRNQGHIDMTDVLLRESKESNNVVVFPVHEYWLDIGRVDEFERAQDEVDRTGRIRSKKRRSYLYDLLVYGGLLLLALSVLSDFLGLGSGPIRGEHVYGPIQIIGNITGLVIVLLGILMKKSLR